MKKYFAKIAILLVICICLPLLVACDNGGIDSQFPTNSVEDKDDNNGSNEMNNDDKSNETSVKDTNEFVVETEEKDSGDQTDANTETKVTEESIETNKATETITETATKTDTLTATINETITETETETETIVFSEGLEFTSKGDGTCYVSGIGNCTDKEIIIPYVSPIGEIVVSIGKEAFKNCINIMSITIPNSVTSISQDAFEFCVGLTSITIPKSVTQIGYAAFNSCFKLVEVINHSSLYVSKGEHSNGYIALNAKKVHKGETEIDNQNGYLFYTYNDINYLMGYVGNDTELHLPESYNGEKYEIYKYAFYCCESITSVTISEGVTNIGYKAFYECSNLKNVMIVKGATRIEESSFQGCVNLAYISIPESVESIEKAAFGGCTSLESIAIPYSVTAIGNSAFSGCIGLTSVIIPDSVTFVAPYAFYYCTSVTSIIISKNVTYIGELAFYCPAVENIYFTGTAEDWAAIKIEYSSYDDVFKNANIIYNYVPEE